LILLLINLTVEQNIIPQGWKESQITMIPKKKANSDNPKDYRPISLTSNIAKLAEKLIAKKIKEFLESNKIIIKQQSGFRHQRQTRDNIFFIVQKIMEQFNRKKKVCAIFFDIGSAFDKNWHIGLITKMVNLKFPQYLINWLSEFLRNRKFRVKCEEYISECFDIAAGVPQGAVLSPILFAIFINDITLLNKKNKDYGLLFADDLVTLNIFKKFGNIEKHINKYLKQLEICLSKWRLKMANSISSKIMRK